ncbi:hypothetical protein ACFQRL_11275 [Microbacterium fluvii]|uniref:Uncharacterized protein n=1 Tax=Microbacterium fluvii TaxID=415215 RepID=A0ABW2HEJ9_9MICO|nr:hypothetical protein [Microbacterium fluvii]MCU4673176.1 hypothetical protein [Microbacterium fluvii]
MSDELGDRLRDTAGVSAYILDNLRSIEDEFYLELVDRVATRAGVTVKDTDLVLRRLREQGLDLSTGVERSVLQAITSSNAESPWAVFVDRFSANRSVVLSFARRERVIAALDRLSVTASNNYTLIAQVVDDVTRGSGTDPAQLTRPLGRTSPWDFQVDLFDSTAGQIVLPGNVRAAGALMWCWDIGERLGVYKLADALVYRWWIGLLDFGDGDLTSELYRYYKLREDRPAEEERFLLYRRVLDLGQTQVGERVVVNEEFPRLWRALMEEVATYIDRSETSYRDRVNAQGVVQAIEEVQYNLTERMAGMALTTVTEMYNQLRQTDAASGALGALDILGHPEVVGQLASGRRRDQWSVIERLSKEEFGVSPNVNALRTSAVEGFKVVDYIADFRRSTLDEDAFAEFISSAKAWILAQDLAGDGILGDVASDRDAPVDDEFDDEFDEDDADDDTWSE